MAEVNIEIYVTTLKNREKGEWISLSNCNSLDEFYKECKEATEGADKSDLLFKEIVCSPLIQKLGLVTKDSIDPEIFDVIDVFYNAPYDLEVYEAAEELFSIIEGQDVSSLIEFADENFVGKYSDDSDFARELTESIEKIPPFLENYIDYDKMGADLLMNDYAKSNGYYFRNS